MTSPSNRTPFSVLMVDAIPNLGLYMDPAQFFPRWTYEPAPTDGFDFDPSPDTVEGDYYKLDNVSDAIIAVYAAELGNVVTSDDVFFCLYAQLHDPHYRESYAADLKKVLPHVPPPPDRARFEKLVAWGRSLADLHVYYENLEPYPLRVDVRKGFNRADRETWRVSKMKWKSKTDHSTIIYNPKVTISGIPDEAESYMLGSRSALGWIIDRYQAKVDKASGIANDPNDWCHEHDDPTYIVDLIGKITRVSVETMSIVHDIAENSQFVNT